MVYLVGAGPGDPALITRRGADLLSRADVVVYDGLANAVLVDLAPADARRIYAGKKHSRDMPPMTQEQICDCLVEQAAAGQFVVRLKGGDPFVFGRGAEEVAALEAAGLAYEVVPGVTAATAVTAYAGIPLTARGAASTAVFATGHESAGKVESDVDWQALARAGTVVLYMAVRSAGECARRLIAAGRDAQTPAAAIHWGTTASQRTVVAPLGELAEAMKREAIRPPALLVVGDVVSLRAPAGSWYERRRLFGARVLVTRGIERASDFAHELSELGAETIVCPVTRIKPRVDRVQLAHCLAGLAAMDWVVFTSANAVERFFVELLKTGADVRALGTCRIACVGPVTAHALGDRLRADLVSARGNAAAVAAAIIEDSGDAIAGSRVLVPRAVSGRDEAIDALRAAGAEVEVLPLYVTEAVAADEPAIAHGLDQLERGRIDVAAFFAPSQVRALLEPGDAAVAAERLSRLRECRLIAAIGNATKNALERAGLAVNVVPFEPTAHALAAAIAASYLPPGPPRGRDHADHHAQPEKTEST